MQTHGGMIGNFFNYLGTTAYKYGDQDRGRISYETATGYAWSIKVYYTDKFRTCGPELNVFGPTKWRQLRNKLLAQFKEDTKTSGKALVNSHTASEDDTDRNAIAIGCYLIGTIEAAEFIHLNNTMMQCSGRGTEVSLLAKNNVNRLLPLTRMPPGSVDRREPARLVSSTLQPVEKR